MRNAVKCCFVVFAVLTFMVCANVASAAVINISVLPNGDGVYHNEMGSSYDYFSSTASPNTAYYFFSGTGNSVNQNTAYAQFYLGTGLTTGDIVSATLNINLLSKTNVGTPDCGDIKHVANSSGATGAASQRLGGTEQVATILNQDLGWVSFNVTDYLKNDVAAGYLWSCFSFHYDTNYNDYNWRSTGYTFSSGEDTENAPYLSITTGTGSTGDNGDTGNNVIPEPATMLLFIGGLFGAAVKRIRK